MKSKKPIMIVKDFETKIPSGLPEDWKLFKGLLESPRIQDCYIYYLTEFATKMQQVRKSPDTVENIVHYFDPSNPGILFIHILLTCR